MRYLAPLAIATLTVVAGCSTSRQDEPPPVVDPDSLTRTMNGWLVLFTWTHNDAPDFEYYTVYWGDTSGFDRSVDHSARGTARGVEDGHRVRYAEVLPFGFGARYYVVTATYDGVETDPSNEIEFIEPADALWSGRDRAYATNR